MIIDIYQYFLQHPSFNKCIGNNYVLVEYKCPLNVEEFRLWTEYHLITFVISGKKDWMAARQVYALTGGDALFVRKGVYTTRQYMEEDYCVMLFLMNDDFIKEFIQQNKIEPDERLQKPNTDPLIKIDTDLSFQTLIKSIFHYMTMSESIPQNLVEIKLKELLFNVVLNKRNGDLRQLLIDISNSAKVRIEHVMNTNFQYDLSLSAFAKLSGRSLSSFKRDFKEHFGATPSKWLIRKRLEYSTTLLLGTDLNVNEICFESGFRNTSHFSKAFKAHYGSTPNQFRVQSQK